MSISRRRLFWVVVALQLLLLLAFAGTREYALAAGREVVLATAPVDPRELFRGDYVVLRYEISSIQGDYAPGEEVYVRLAESDGIWRTISVDRVQPSDGEVFIKGRVARGRRTAAGPPTADVEYGIESYFVPEGTGQRIEQARGKLRIRVALDGSGNATIKELLLGD